MSKKPSISKTRALIRRGKKQSKLKKTKRYIPIKSSEVTSSKIEKIFEKVLLEEGIPVKSQHQIGYKFYDFKIEGTNILIEFDGDYYHANPEKFPKGTENAMQIKNIQNDLYKDRLAKLNGFELIRIWESDFRENPNKIIKQIKKNLKENK